MADKAERSTLNDLHSMIAEHFLKVLGSGEASAAELAVMVKFLKDNGIEADLDQAPKLGEIKDRLPFTEPVYRQ